MDADFRGLGFSEGDLAVVTGAGNGIGRATAHILARSGVAVAAWDMAEDPLDELLKEISQIGQAPAYKMVVDTTDDAAIEAAWQQTARIGLPVRYLVNNAGPPSFTPLSVAEGARLAIGSYVAVTESWLSHYPDDASSVTFTASTAGNYVGGSGMQAWYPTVKMGIVGYVRHLAVQQRGRPRVNAIAPGLTVTPRTAVHLTPESAERIKKEPLGRPAQPEEQAAGICFLLSPAASFINGVLLPIEGGVSWMSR